MKCLSKEKGLLILRDMGHRSHCLRGISSQDSNFHAVWNKEIRKTIAFLQNLDRISFLRMPYVMEIEDWALYYQPEMALIECIRSAHDCVDRLIDSPFHVFDEADRNLAVGYFAMTISFKWKSCLYGAAGDAILNWEGDYLHFWTRSASHKKSITALLNDFDS